MPRTKNYIRSEALEKACNAFWKYGYDALGVRAIEEQTGLNRFAIQTDFGGKEGLFLEVLEKYADVSIDCFIDPIRQGDVSAIKQFFVDMTTPQENDPRLFGCLMVNTVVENAAPQRTELKRRTDAHYARMHGAFKSALLNTREKGQLTAGFDIDEAATFLLALAMGIQVYIRMNGSFSQARQQTNMALKIIDSWCLQTKQQ